MVSTQLLGGLGLFLFGMVTMTDGLKACAGDALRGLLLRWVRGPWSGLCAGAFLTALVQSSTATTVTTIGFVSAGLLRFPQALGVVFGANLGTTSTGWLVSLLGFKVSLGSIAGPLVLAGVVLRLLLRGRSSQLGTALAGFGLLFLGIDLLQDGMAGIATHLDLSAYAGAGLGNRMILVGLGALLTVVVQSSSAAMATTLAAVGAGALSLEQAAAMAIGQNVGTTLTAALAALGAPTAARRTALAHVLFNLFTAALAVPLLPSLLWLANLPASGGAHDAALALAAFHTLFNVLGTAVLLPAHRPFAALLERLLPEHDTTATRFLGAAVATLGPVAQEAARRALLELRAECAGVATILLSTGLPTERVRQQLDRIELGLGDTRAFLGRLGEAAQSPAECARQASLLHSTEHLSRLLGRLREPPRALQQTAASHDPLVAAARPALETLLGVANATTAAERSAWLAEHRRTERRRALDAAAHRQLDVAVAMDRIDALVWFDQLAYHLWRSLHHLQAEPAKAATPA
ncbi:MAG: Na/Pi cotransporter family protein [Planctomycetes bacterium]|nr:Na/Pi cotransporter family protein [Planctomycetota bacterium]